MADVLLISKPIEPPWNDGSKTLARDLACAMERHVPIVLATRGSSFEPPRGRVERILGSRAQAHALPPLDALRVLARVARGGRGAVVHFFFQPNPRTSAAARAVLRMRPRPSVHTVSSAPRADLDPRRALFADRTVVLSRATESRMRDAGARGVVRVAPAVAPIPVPSDADRRRARARFALPADAPVICFPGDLERGEGAVAAIDALAALGGDAVLAIAWRAKSARTREAERSLRERAAARGVGGRVRWIGETAEVHSLLGASDVVALTSRDLGAKVDLPIVLIEAMWQARCVVVAKGSPAEELAEEGGALAVEPAPDALAAVLRRLIDDAGERARSGAAARAAAEAHHDPIAMARRYEAIYDELLG